MKKDQNPFLLSPFGAGCSALSWETLDGKHLWGRNYDFDRLAEGSSIVYIPSGTDYLTCISAVQEDAPEAHPCSRYACTGVGFLSIPSAPVLYEGINEKGLMGGQLYYRELACFSEEEKPHTYRVQPPFAVYHALAQCSGVEEVIRLFQEEASLVSVPLMGTVPPLHWCFSDRSGETIILEPDRGGLTVYRNTIGVMTNSPGYSWHRLNLLNYAGIRDRDYETVKICGDSLPPYFSGSGAQGLPGDWSSPSRFIRLAFLKQFSQKGRSEEEGVGRMFHLFQSVAFPLGMIRVTGQGHRTEYDRKISPFDYTVYTSILCAESLRFYWTTYENQQVQYMDLNHLLHHRRPLQFDLNRRADFRCRSRHI